MKKVIEAVFESKDDFEIFVLLSEKIGGQQTKHRYTGGKSYMEWIKAFYDKSDGPAFKILSNSGEMAL